ncbi:MAG: TlpA family protein disulfide reductase [Chloroflexi bacterium]|nr:TlpA family protein disulfide reductase [Chloroflexota bacterium]
MTDDAADLPRQPSRRSFARRWLYPVAVVVAIAGVIWWIEARDSGGVSSTGERYGPVDLPAALVPAGASIKAEEGALAPDFLLEALNGDETRLSDFRGQPVVLNFWATWCAPCRKEMPQFIEAYDVHRDEGLVVVGLNLQESESIIRPFVDDFGINFPVLIDRDGEVGDDYRLLGLPATYFIGRDGVIESLFIGPFEAEVQGTNVQGAIGQSDLEERIAEILD